MRETVKMFTFRKQSQTIISFIDLYEVLNLTSFTIDFISLFASCKSSGFLLFKSLAKI